MNGLELIKWSERNKLGPDQLATIMKVSRATVYKWYSALELDYRTVLALAHLGCKEAQSELNSDEVYTQALAAVGR